MAKGYLGRTADGEAVYVEIVIREREGDFETTEHATVNRAVGVSFSGHTFRRYSRRQDCDRAGLIIRALDEIVTFARGWDVRSVRRLATLWHEWHLNYMTAGCAHQTPVMAPDEYGRMMPSVTLTPGCPETGYRYGDKWLVRTVPDGILAEIHTLAERLDGTDGYRR